MTFRVDSERGRFALRVNVSSTHGVEKLLGEIAFVQHLSAAKSFKVAAPVAKLDGTFIASIQVAGIERPINGVLYEWLPDPTVGENVTEEIMFGLGRATRELHQLGAGFRFKKKPFPTLTEPYYGDKYRLPEQDLDLAVFEECANRALQVFAKIEPLPKIPIHADLHLHNVKFGSQGLSIFDFDDAMISWPIMDAAITMWYFRCNTKAPQLEADYWDGFGATPADSHLSQEEFETLVAARTLLLVNDVVGTQNANAKANAATFIRRCEALLLHYLQTGRFSPREVLG